MSTSLSSLRVYFRDTVTATPRSESARGTAVFFSQVTCLHSLIDVTTFTQRSVFSSQASKQRSASKDADDANNDRNDDGKPSYKNVILLKKKNVYPLYIEEQRLNRGSESL